MTTGTNEPRYPEIEVEFIGQDGNVFGLIGIVSKALRRADVPKEVRDEFMAEVTSAESYDEAIQTMMRWVEVN